MSDKDPPIGVYPVHVPEQRMFMYHAPFRRASTALHRPLVKALVKPLVKPLYAWYHARRPAPPSRFALVVTFGGPPPARPHDATAVRIVLLGAYTQPIEVPSADERARWATEPLPPLEGA